MKKIYIKTFLAILLVCTCLFACKKKVITPAPTVVGTWELRQTISGNLSLSYPVGNGNKYQFTADAHFTQFKNDTLTAQGTYAIKSNAETINNVVYSELLLNNAQSGRVVQAGDSTLSLGLEYNGGTASIYAKIQ